MTWSLIARAKVASELTPRMVPANPAFRKARANDPPIRPTPKIATVSMGAAELQSAAYGWSDHAELLHEFPELLRTQGLSAVAQGTVRIGMHFYQQSVRARCHSRARHGNYFVTPACPVRRIGHDGQ